MESIYLKVTTDYVPDDKEVKFGGKNAAITVEKGDIIFDVRKLENGWLSGKNLNTGKSGRFPSSCTAKLSDASSDKESTSSGSSPKSEKSKPAERKESASSKPLNKGWQRDSNTKTSDPVKPTEPTGNIRRPANPRPFALSSRTPVKTIDQDRERKETSGDSGVVEDSEDYYLNDEPPDKTKGKAFTETKKQPETGRVTDTRKPTSAESEAVKKPSIYEPSRFGSKTYSPLYSTRPSVSKLKSNFFDKDSKGVKVPDMKEEKDKEKGTEAIEMKKRPANSQPSKKSEDKVNGAKAAVGRKDDDDGLYANYTEVEETKPSDENKNEKPEEAKEGSGKNVNIKENPLAGNEGAPYHSYQVPQPAPEKPPRHGGCSECDEPHVYAAPSPYYKQPPSSPETGPGKYDFDPTENQNSTQEKLPLDKPKDKAKEEANRRSYNRMASYESIGNIGAERNATRARSTESIKEAVKTVKKTRDKLLTPGRFPRMKMVGGIILGVLLGVFVFLMLYLLIPVPAVAAIVAGIIVGFLFAITLGFLDRKRILCIMLLIFPSLFASRGKIVLWILVTFFIIAGPLCNFIGNVHIIATSRGCVGLAGGNDSSENNSQSASNNLSSPTAAYSISPLIRQYKDMTQELKEILNTTLSKMNYHGVNASTPRTICMNFLRGTLDTCTTWASNLYTYCQSQFSTVGKEAKVREKCKNLKPGKLCVGPTEINMNGTCREIDLDWCKNALIEIREIVNRSPGHGLAAGYSLVPTTNEREKCCSVVAVLAMLLPLLILVVLYEAYRYHKLYMVKNNFDNQYLTSHFKTIEDTRKSSGAGDGLIPLKKGELERFIQPTSCQFTVAERTDMMKYLIVYFLYLVFSLIFVLGDYYLYYTITKNNKQPERKGTRTVNETNTTAAPVESAVLDCVPKVLPLEDIYIIYISALLGVLLLMIVTQPYMLRLRHYIASLFYRRRERKRIAYLYYKLLEERKVFLKGVIDKINLRSEENHAMDRLDVVRVLAWNFTTMERLFSLFGVNLRKCMVCRRGLNRKYIYCSTENCEAVYCRTCFWDLENKCLGCMQKNSHAVSRSSSCSSGSTRKKKTDPAQSV